MISQINRLKERVEKDGSFTRELYFQQISEDGNIQPIAQIVGWTWDYVLEDM